jgi:putative endonuclease
MNNKKLGNFGEALATFYLKLKGYEILERNFLIKGGEIDIIARNKRDIVIVEVKTRKDNGYGRPEEAVGTVKKKNLIYSARVFEKRWGIKGERIRFDVIAITLKPFKIKHIKDAFIRDDV